MGLDQNAYAISKHDAELLESQEYLDGEMGIESEEELMYWRKHANLNEWMTQLAFRKGHKGDSFNCDKVWLTHEDIDELNTAVMNDDLPHGVGFFWGSSMPEDKEKDLEFIAKARYALNQGKLVYYTCWY